MVRFVRPRGPCVFLRRQHNSARRHVQMRFSEASQIVGDLLAHSGSGEALGRDQGSRPADGVDAEAAQVGLDDLGGRRRFRRGLMHDVPRVPTAWRYRGPWCGGVDDAALRRTMDGDALQCGAAGSPRSVGGIARCRELHFSFWVLLWVKCREVLGVVFGLQQPDEVVQCLLRASGFTA